MAHTFPKDIIMKNRIMQQKTNFFIFEPSRSPKIRRGDRTGIHINTNLWGRIKKKKKGRPKPSLHMAEFTLKAPSFLRRML
jgi:hypothetical protein